MEGTNTTTATRRVNRQSALADIQFASIVDPDLTPSEDETPDEREFQLETVQSAIGVSIGQEQTRLTSPKTPAAEKAAALDDADGGALFEGWQQSFDETIEQSTTPPPALSDSQSDDNESQVPTPTQPRDPVRVHGKKSSTRMPSPWRAGPKQFQKPIQEGDHRAVLRDSFKSGSRRRASSGSSAGDMFKKYMSFNLPSMPKSPSFLNFTLPSFSVSPSDYTRGGSPARIPQKRATYGSHVLPQQDGSSTSRVEEVRGRPRSMSQPRHSSTDPIPQRQFVPISSPSPDVMSQDAPSGVLQRRPTPRLRRSTSEGSLMIHRTRSFASSLGDDTRFEHISEQVNSRLKAIKDSWQDTNFKLPSLPTMPNFNLGVKDPPAQGSHGGLSTGPERVSFFANTSNLRLPRAKNSSSSIAGMNSTAASTHPYFTKALQELTGDLVVLGGYRGSILRSAEAPNRQLWVPIKVGLNLRKVDLQLGLNPEDEETEHERIIPGGMLTHIGPVDIAKRLLKRLKNSENARNGTLRIHNYGYDWRLSPHILSRKLTEFVKALPCNQPGVPPEKRGAIVLAHSLGGLITRHAINHNPELFAGVVYAGVPQGCVNILGPLRNGDDVLLSSRVLTAQVNFTIRTSFALLPLDGKCFINKHTKEEYPVDFFDIKTWKDHSLSPCIEAPLPHPNAPPSTMSERLFSAMSQALPSLPTRKYSLSRPANNSNSNLLSSSPSSTPSNPAQAATDVAQNATDKIAEGGAQTTGVTPQMGNSSHKAAGGQDFPASQSNPATAVTIPKDAAIAYLTRTLAETKAFKLALAHRPEHTSANVYPPIALIYGKSVPTVYGAKVESREAIKRADVYDELAFASGDGVVLARAAMVPQGYSVVRGGIVSSDRGHVTLLGDLEAVGRCLSAVVGARRSGVGVGEDKGMGKKRER
ncbi:hypothetical protein B0J11DRAFT_544775 [Dendryphion nanum]|uniref:Uncharacterized protein n=1 Tax=Dendryphion nanum TaxID=256645 RepID=A0A9P9CZH6_9PLEO|nr:hypothetical protein B0J11DRAFT_544775 [Dendryphion nanum]